MQRSGSTAVPVVQDDGSLRALVERPGPVVSIWVNRPDPLPASITSRVQRARDELRDLLPAEVVESVASLLSAGLPRSPGMVVIAGEDGVRFVEHTDTPLRHEATLYSELPSLAPVIEHRQAQIPFVLAAIDRRGADLYWRSGDQQGERVVEGDDTFITKVQAGGWSHRTYQQRAENTWERNAAEIAGEIEQLVQATGARIVIAASETRMEQLLREQLSVETRPLLRTVSGSRTDDGSDAERTAQLERWIKSAIAEDTVATLRLFDQERGQLDRASNGPGDTLRALRESRVDTLLLHDDGTDARSAFFDRDEPGLVALDRATIRDLGREPAGPARLDDVAVRACLLTGAGIRIVPAHSSIDDGIGAILRW